MYFAALVRYLGGRDASSWNAPGGVPKNGSQLSEGMSIVSSNMSVSRVRAGNVEEEEGGSASKNVKPERNLLSAVLARAICDAFGTAQCDRHVVRSARQWLFGPLQPTRAFSFAWVAQHLDLDPVQLQHSLKNYETNPDVLQERLSLLR